MMGPSYGELWVGCMNETFAPLRWIECHPSLAGYLQAVGVVAAVVVAFYAPRITAHFEERRYQRLVKRRTAQAFATQRADMADVEANIARVHETLTRWENRQPPAQAWDNVFDSAIVLPMPSSIAFAHEIPDIDRTALQPFEAVRAAISDYNGHRLRIRNGPRSTINDEPWRVECAILIAQLHTVAERCRDAVAASYR